MKFNLKFLLLLIAGCAVLTLTWITIRHHLLKHDGTSGYGVASARANAMLPSILQLPKSAEDVNYYSDFGASHVEFRIRQADFLAWCQSNGWEPKPIMTSTRYIESDWLAIESHTVESGYQFSATDLDGLFDADSSRATVLRTSFP